MRRYGTGQWIHTVRFAIFSQKFQNIQCQLYFSTQVHEVEDVETLYNDLMDLIVRLGNAGVIHGDFNEFNIMVTDDAKPILIDFPQMVSTSHPNARM